MKIVIYINTSMLYLKEMYNYTPNHLQLKINNSWLYVYVNSSRKWVWVIFTQCLQVLSIIIKKKIN